MKTKTKRKRLIYSRTPLVLTDLGREVEGEMLMAIESKIMAALLRRGYSPESLDLVLKSAAKNWPAWREG